MKQLTASVDSTEGLIAFLGRSETKFAVASSRSVLVQIYTGVCEERWICDLVGSVRQHIPAATIAGATTFGEIREAQAMTGGTVVILSCFQSATVEALQLPCTAGQEERAALVLADNLRRAPEPIKAVLLLATTLSLDATALLSHLFATMPGLPLFGGGAGDNGALQQSFVFSDNGVIQEGLVAIAVCGGTLEIIRHTYLGWEPMGKAMTVTQVSGLTLHTLDGAPAFDVYRRYLGIDADEFFFKNAMEFPFLVERHGRLFARIPAEVLDDGSIKFTADIQEGEVLQFGYAHVDSLVANVTATEAAVRRFAPEAINIYSCGTRHFVMQDDVSLELAPFQNIASTAGFFTYGEFCDLGVGNINAISTLHARHHRGVSVCQPKPGKVGRS